ncbi:uncharacterized protein LOC114301777 isoform X4 [Camellia sinensis]|uniref:uncharacterized protein LOC114301777 isoform X4 n=1 Tax=Camellia sinensis TaxID=4442 RepID=UPI001036192D|nr:uncharacterized protein LOC114301777 isoform X4 [Camellia sinensis]
MPLCGSLLINITKFSRFPLCFTLTLTLSAYGFCIRAQCLSRFWDHLSQFDQASLSLSYEWKQGKRRLKDKSLNLSIPGITGLRYAKQCGIRREIGCLFKAKNQQCLDKKKDTLD